VASLALSAGGYSVGKPANITARAGYDNQPSFSPDGRSIYFTSQRAGQTDIYRHELAGGTNAQVTATAENEYSPTVMPDGRHFSVIRDSVQLLWAFTLEGNPVRPLLDSIKPIGYHTWLNADTVFVFVLGSPATLRRAELQRGTAEVVARDIGRGLARIPGRRAISYAQRDSSGMSVRSIDPVTGVGETVTRLPAENEFFAWAPSGDLFSASGNRLLLLRPREREWTEVARFSETGLQQISRLAISPSGDRIALVGAEPGPPP
jgi:dipeptidyl aminopeptidase/acylaminoacyl peptidase